MARAFHNLGRTIGGAGVVCPSRFLRTYAIHCLFPIRTLGVGEHKKNLGGGRCPTYLCALPPILTTPRLFALLHWPASIPSCVRLVPFLAQLCSFHESAAAAASTSPTFSLVAGTLSPWY